MASCCNLTPVFFRKCWGHAAASQPPLCSPYSNPHTAHADPVFYLHHTLPQSAHADSCVKTHEGGFTTEPAEERPLLHRSGNKLVTELCLGTWR